MRKGTFYRLLKILSQFDYRPTKVHIMQVESRG